jgi:hypothetical protein
MDIIKGKFGKYHRRVQPTWKKAISILTHGFSAHMPYPQLMVFPMWASLQLIHFKLYAISDEYGTALSH